jgi:hypothetical protein
LLRITPCRLGRSTGCDQHVLPASNSFSDYAGSS